MVCARGLLATGELRIAGAAAQTRGVCAEFGCMVLPFELPSTNNPAPRPLAIPLRAKRNLAAEVPGLSMLVLNKLHYREISSCAHVALLQARPIVW